MIKKSVQDLRAVAFCGHGASGKTTLVESLLFHTGVLEKPGNVDEGTTCCDFDPEEQSHHYSIESALVHFDHHGRRFFVFDTPGYPDFLGQTLGALQAVETAVIAINAGHGIEVNTRRVFQEAGKLHLGRMIVLTKLDQDNIDFAELIQQIRTAFGKECLLMNVPNALGHDFTEVVSVLEPGDKKSTVMDAAALGEELLETIIEVDEEMTARYFEGELPNEEEIDRLMSKAIAEGHLIPILCVSGKNDAGIDELLDALELGSVPPNGIQRYATNGSESPEPLTFDENGPLIAQVVKTRIDPFVQRLSFLKVYSGTLHKDQSVHVSGVRKDLKLHQLLSVQGEKTEPVDQAIPGEIVAVPKMEELVTGRCLGDAEVEALHFPTPMVGLAVTPKSRGDEAKLSVALHKLTEEDPTLHLDRDSQTHELVMTGMSELHLQIMQERLRRRDHVEIETHEPKIPYRETIQAEAEGSYRHKKQSGGRGQFGEVHIRMYPFPRGTKPEEFTTKERFPQLKSYHYDEDHNFLWVDSIVGGSIPGNFLPAVEKGFKERLNKGVLAGYRVQNVCVEVYYGKHHPVDSSEAAFKMAASKVFSQVFKEASPCLLEPLVSLHVTVPNDSLGDVNSDLAGRRGKTLGMEAAGGNMQMVHAEVPLSEVTTYARTLSSMTGGQGSYTIEFSHYDVVPSYVMQSIIDQSNMVEDEDE
ncbi:Small GTP-binding protein domain [Planctomycetales bacterium 10988]|nr:Small GTP-binding protein domain [Planctomycetales bacterium 10988]